jgi:hypothetical protein
MYFVFVSSSIREEIVGYSFNVPSFSGIMPLFLPCRSLSYFALSFISNECSVQLILVQYYSIREAICITGVMKPV